jgi:LytS/YehU family sensor histidine kinase
MAEEFSIINKISSSRLIPLSQEIELCRFHLRIMNIRLETDYHLSMSDIPDDELIPPLIFHTIIENGITHNTQPVLSSTFYLTCSREIETTEYSISNSQIPLPLYLPVKEDLKEGLGLKYIRIRLQECFPGRWALKYNFSGQIWQVSITIRK